MSGIVLLKCGTYLQNLNGPAQGGQGEDGDESWDEDDEASSYRDDDSSSDGEDAEGQEMRTRPPTSQPTVHTIPASTVPSTSGAHAKELEWDHSSM
jgi:hypothetical protein